MGIGRFQHLIQRLGYAFTTGGGCMSLFSRCLRQEQDDFSFYIPGRGSRMGLGLQGSSEQSDGMRLSGGIFLCCVSVCLPVFSFRASIPQNAGSHSLLVDLDFMHSFGAQTETISHSNVLDSLFTRFCRLYSFVTCTDCLCMCDTERRVASSGVAMRLESLKCALARRLCNETRHPCARACHRLYLNALAASQNSMFAI